LRRRRGGAHDLAMAESPKGRLVYASDRGRVCTGCGWAEGTCRCSSRPPDGGEPVPPRIVARLRIEKTGRGGKTVTVIDGLPRNPPFVASLAQELRRACGTGGAVRDGAIELQGDIRDRVRELLSRKGYVVKG
jgi:translation initiation factor 1